MGLFAWGERNAKEDEMMMATENAAPHDDVTAEDLMESLKITKIKRRGSSGPAWVIGTMGGHRFEALVFAEHATSSDFELEDSRISKLWVQRIADKATAAQFDRGWDKQPTTLVAARIVDLLAEGLAEYVYED
jgi:hypothetical protein